MMEPRTGICGVCRHEFCISDRARAAGSALPGGRQAERRGQRLVFGCGERRKPEGRRGTGDEAGHPLRHCPGRRERPSFLSLLTGRARGDRGAAKGGRGSLRGCRSRRSPHGAGGEGTAVPWQRRARAPPALPRAPLSRRPSGCRAKAEAGRGRTAAVD